MEWVHWRQTAVFGTLAQRPLDQEKLTGDAQPTMFILLRRMTDHTEPNTSKRLLWNSTHTRP